MVEAANPGYLGDVRDDEEANKEIMILPDQINPHLSVIIKDSVELCFNLTKATKPKFGKDKEYTCTELLKILNNNGIAKEYTPSEIYVKWLKTKIAYDLQECIDKKIETLIDEAKFDTDIVKGFAREQFLKLRGITF